MLKSWGPFQNAYMFLNLGTLKFSPLHKIHISQCMIFCVEFQRVPMKFHAKYLTYTLKKCYQCNVEILQLKSA